MSLLSLLLKPPLLAERVHQMFGSPKHPCLPPIMPRCTHTEDIMTWFLQSSKEQPRTHTEKSTSDDHEEGQRQRRGHSFESNTAAEKPEQPLDVIFFQKPVSKQS
jgi:hypothetical protein